MAEYLLVHLPLSLPLPLSLHLPLSLRVLLFVIPQRSGESAVVSAVAVLSFEQNLRHFDRSGSQSHREQRSGEIRFSTAHVQQATKTFTLAIDRRNPCSSKNFASQSSKPT
jgi:hypothetical protein